ncbi:hypothetical protein [Dinoroseobacter sp. S124A]|uniref:hypothetical protein n=1 Tax=Dinoroseobacter sp. S124A TaxID=3415128 RepID=UPI003C7B2CA5
MPFKTPVPILLTRICRAVLACAGACCLGGIMATSASADVATRAVYLEAQDGTRFAIADLQIEDGAYDLSLRDAPFSDHFLSMRPFKCLAGAEKHWCYVPYPYENARNISTEFTDLEYDLLFLWKGAGEYGINMWNGVYYKLEAEGDRLVGVMHEMDMDILSAPPEDGDLRPVRAADLEPAEPDSHWLPRLVIE